MPGSSASIATPNVVLNTSVAESLKQFADELEQADDFESTLHDLIRRTIHEHKRIIFNGNGYDDSWVKEAERRGLCNYRSTPDAIPHMLDEKNVKLYEDHGVITRTELESRYEIGLDTYSKTVNIEARTMLDMARKDILPAVSSYKQELATTITSVQESGVEADCSYETETLSEESDLGAKLYAAVKILDEKTRGAAGVEDSLAKAHYFHDEVLPAMEDVRTYADKLELITDKDYWPFPTYSDLLFSVK